MTDDLRHNMNLVIPGLNFWGDQDDAAKSVVDKTKWVMQTAIDHIEKLEAALQKIAYDVGGEYGRKEMMSIAQSAIGEKDG